MKKVNISGRWWLWIVLGFGAGAWFMAPVAPTSPVQGAASREARAELDPVERNVVDVFQRVSPAVVNVSNLAQRRTFFDVQEVPQGSGTGFVWDKQGHVVTNFHVIYGASSVAVTFADQTTRRAKVVGYYEGKDLAVLQ